MNEYPYQYIKEYDLIALESRYRGAGVTTAGINSLFRYSIDHPNKNIVVIDHRDAMIHFIHRTLRKQYEVTGFSKLVTHATKTSIFLKNGTQILFISSNKFASVWDKLRGMSVDYLHIENVNMLSYSCIEEVYDNLFVWIRSPSVKIVLSGMDYVDCFSNITQYFIHLPIPGKKPLNG